MGSEERYPGERQAKAWREFKAAPVNAALFEGTTSGEYLSNRLWYAFMEGYLAASAPNPKGETK